MNKIKTCRAYLPPSFSEICGKEVDPICQNQCFKHCYNKDYPETHYLRCKNPHHPPYQESEFLKQFKQNPSSCDELTEEMEKINQILNHQNGLKAKLDLWENYQAIAEEQLQAKIVKLKREKAQLRAFLHEIIEAHYRVINQEPASQAQGGQFEKETRKKYE
ncbi:8233_t:CDS:2 [Entrophospora sp. SA101]|nr:8917_t:CDS:2 [Entrophospora sp. SA101]CAJ0892532.1 8233_t:CDS:2 [Entrophospora sp. SA101]